MYPGQLTTEETYAQRQRLLQAYGSPTTNDYRGRANPYEQDNPALQARNAAAVGEARTQAANASNQMASARTAMGMAPSGLNAEDRRNVELATAKTLSGMLNTNFINDYDKRAAWDTNNLQLANSQDNAMLSHVMELQANDRANAQVGTQQEQFNKTLEEQQAYRKQLFDQSFWQNILGAVGLGAGAATQFFTQHPEGQKMLAAIMQAVGGTFEQGVQLIGSLFSPQNGAVSNTLASTVAGTPTGVMAGAFPPIGAGAGSVSLPSVLGTGGQTIPLPQTSTIPKSMTKLSTGGGTQGLLPKFSTLAASGEGAAPVLTPGATLQFPGIGEITVSQTGGCVMVNGVVYFPPLPGESEQAWLQRMAQVNDMSVEQIARAMAVPPKGGF